MARKKERKALSNTYNLLAIRPDIASEWHASQNLGLKPKEFSPGSGKKVWWHCDKNDLHSYEARISHRTSANSGCPYCAGQKVDKTNSLASLYPDLAKEWHPTKNGTVSPWDITARTTRKFWWKCPKSDDHIWETAVAVRSRGHGCPFCSNNSSAPELRLYAELQEIFPNVINRQKLDGIEIDLYIPDIGVGVEYDGAFWHSKKSRVDLEKNKKIKALGIQLFRLREHPLKLLTENDILIPRKELKKAHIDELLKKVASFSDFHRSKINSYLKSNAFCASDRFQEYLSHLPNPIPEKSLEKLYPRICAQWDYKKNSPLTPKNFSPGSKKKVFWNCSKDTRHNFSMPVVAVVKAGGKCPICSGKRVHWTNSLETSHPDIAGEWDFEKNKNLLPDKVTGMSNKKVWWRCSLNKSHSWIAAIFSRARGSGCPYCNSGRLSEDNNLEKKFPEIASQWHPTKNNGVLPSQITGKSDKKFWWQCDVNPDHSWKASVGSRTGLQTSCPFCSGLYPSPENNLKVALPEICKQWDYDKNFPLIPEKVTPKSGKKVWWICASDPRHSFQAAIFNRAAV